MFEASDRAICWSASHISGAAHMAYLYFTQEKERETGESRDGLQSCQHSMRLLGMCLNIHPRAKSQWQGFKAWQLTLTFSFTPSLPLPLNFTLYTRTHSHSHLHSHQSITSNCLNLHLLRSKYTKTDIFRHRQPRYKPDPRFTSLHTADYSRYRWRRWRRKGTSR